MTLKHLDAKGEIDYDLSNDILFFKVKNREYDHSIELEDVVLDVDREGYATGIQLFGASTMLDAEKDSLKKIRSWGFAVKIEGKTVTIQITLEMTKKNRVIERGQSVIREAPLFVTDSEVLCKVEA